MFSRKRDGFSLIELLTVIAIIGILAALIFPIVGTAKKKAKQTQCINNMFQIFTALKQFQLDEHRYPDFIAGPAVLNVPLDESTGMIDNETVALFPEYIKSVSGLKCPLSLLHGGGGAEYMMSDAVNDPMFQYWVTAVGAGATKKSKRADGYMPNGTPPAQAYALYAYSSYDYQCPKYPSASPQAEAHYAPLWYYEPDPTAVVAPYASSYERQLWWRTPPESTVITWCSFHRDNDINGSKDLVLWLDGHVKPVPSAGLADWKTVWMNISPSP